MGTEFPEEFFFFFFVPLRNIFFKGVGGWGDSSASKVLKFDPRTHLEKSNLVTLSASEVERGRSWKLAGSTA